MDPQLVEREAPSSRPAGTFAAAADHAECRRLHRRHGVTYYFATQCLAPRMRRRVHALYGFVRVPDEWVDGANSLSVVRRRRMLEDYRNQFLRGLDGVLPDQPVLRVFCDLVHETGLTLEEPLRFLDAMAADLSVCRYPTYEALRGYMRGSAVSVGVMMCTLLEARVDESTRRSAVALGEAMQLTNFLRDVREDAARGRIYLPLEDLAKFGVTEEDILDSRFSPAFARLMEFEIARARALYAEADVAIAHLPGRARRAVRLASLLYSRILNRIEDQSLDVFSRRAQTSRLEKIATLARVMLGR